VQALATQLHVHQASPLVTWSTAGVKKIMANAASRIFNGTNVTKETFTITDDKFLHNFNSCLPHPQATSLQLFQFSSKLSMLILF
jgi:hypothetical protein